MLPTEAVPEIWEMSDCNAGFPEKYNAGRRARRCARQALLGSDCFCR